MIANLQSARARTLRSFTGSCLLFLLPVLGLLCLLEWQIRQVGTLHRSRARSLQRTSSSAAVIVTGNSHETVGVVCSELGLPCAKLAAGSQSVFLDAKLLQRYANAFPQARLLLIGLSYYSFEYALEAEESWRVYEYWHAYGIDGERLPVPRADLRRYSLLATYGGETSLRYALQGFPAQLPAARADRVGEVDVSAFVQRERSLSALTRRLAKHENTLRPELVPEAMASVASMIDWARSRGVVPVLVVSPVTRAYAQAADRQVLASMRDALASLSRNHGARIADYFSDDRFSEKEFFDFDHLTHEGALHYTALLRREVVGSLKTTGR